MRTSSPNSGSIVRLLKRIPLQKLSKETAFCKRKSKKITPREFILGFFLMLSSPGAHSYQQWATKIGTLKHKTISKQALWKRIKPAGLCYLETVLAYTIAHSLQKSFSFPLSKKLRQFQNIIIEDGTHIRVNNKLASVYPGSVSGSHKTAPANAIVKLQVSYNLTKAKFERFSITNFRKPDQGYACEILSIVKRGDLIIRDLGYFAFKVFRAFENQGVYFISRLRHKTLIYSHKEDKTPIDLAAMLQKRGHLDISVFIGEEDRVPVRLVALPVEGSVAAERRRKANADRDKRHPVDRGKLYLLGWELFITNVEDSKLMAADIAALYFLRWRIEIIFKCWKSYMKVQQVATADNKYQLNAYIYCMLLFVVLIQVGSYQYYHRRYAEGKEGTAQRDFSLMKLTEFIADNIEAIIYSEYNEKVFRVGELDRQIDYYCRYERRHDRINFCQKIAS